MVCAGSQSTISVRSTFIEAVISREQVACRNPQLPTCNLVTTTRNNLPAICNVESLLAAKKLRCIKLILSFIVYLCFDNILKSKYRVLIYISTNVMGQHGNDTDKSGLAQIEREIIFPAKNY